MTGQYTHNHKAYTIYGKGGGFDSFDSHNALPTWLQRAGYDTLFIGKYLNGYGDAGSGTARHIEPGWTQWRPTVGGSTYNFMHPTLNRNGRLVKYHQYNSNLFADQTVDLLEVPAAASKPWFMSVNYVAPHTAAALDADDPQLRYPATRAPGSRRPSPPPRTSIGSGTSDCPSTPTCSGRSATGWNNGAPMSALRSATPVRPTSNGSRRSRASTAGWPGPWRRCADRTAAQHRRHVHLRQRLHRRPAQPVRQALQLQRLPSGSRW